MGVDRHGAQGADDVDAEMVEEASILGRQHLLDEKLRHFVERHGFVVFDAAPADLIAVAIEEGDGEIGAFQPVLVGGRLERRLRQRQQQHKADEADVGGLAGEVEAKLGEPAQPQPLGSGGDAAERPQRAPSRGEHRGIDERVEGEQAPAHGAPNFCESGPAGQAGSSLRRSLERFAVSRNRICRLRDAARRRRASDA